MVSHPSIFLQIYACTKAKTVPQMIAVDVRIISFLRKYNFKSYSETVLSMQNRL